MCRFCLQCPQDKSDSEGGASPTAPENHLGGCRVTGPALRSWGLSRVLPHPRPPTPAALGSVGVHGGSRKGLPRGSFWTRRAPHSGNSV